MRAKIDMLGQRYTRLVVVSEAEKDANGEQKWMCACDCGNLISLRGSSLRRNNTRSCGCLEKELRQTKNVTHNGTGTRLYTVWANMVQRCTNENDSRWASYGGRGISVCQEWREFGGFQKWACENGYSDSLTIDRIDNDGNYCPENCRWVDLNTQANNKRNNHRYTHEGKTLTIPQWAKLVGINPKTLSTRLHKYGWSLEKALSEPVRRQHE